MGMPTISIIEQSIEVDAMHWVTAVALIDGAVVGTAQINGWENESPMLGYVYVVPEHRNQNIGTALIVACINHARIAGKRAISLVVNKKNEAAERLYRRLEFVQCNDDEKQRWLVRALSPLN